MHTCTHAHAHARTHARIHTCTYTHKSIHTHLHTQVDGPDGGGRNGSAGNVSGVGGLHADCVGRGNDPCLPHVLLLEESVAGESSLSSGEGVGEGEEGSCSYGNWGGGHLGVLHDVCEESHQQQQQQQLQQQRGGLQYGRVSNSAAKGLAAVSPRSALGSKPPTAAPASRPRAPRLHRTPLLHDLAQYRLHGRWACVRACVFMCVCVCACVLVCVCVSCASA